MIRVTVEEVPAGDEDRAVVIDRMFIANVSDLAPVSAYTVWLESMPEDRRRIGEHMRALGWAPLLFAAAARFRYDTPYPCPRPRSTGPSSGA